MFTLGRNLNMPVVPKPICRLSSGPFTIFLTKQPINPQLIMKKHSTTISHLLTAVFIRDESRPVDRGKGWQIGLSFAAAYKAVRLVTLRTARLDVWVASRDGIRRCRLCQISGCWASGLDLAANAFEQTPLLRSGNPVQVQVLKFATRLAFHCSTSSLTLSRAGQISR